MAIGLRIKLPTARGRVRRGGRRAERRRRPPEGIIFHSAGPIEEGWGVIDFWESRDHFDRFKESRLGPAIGTLGDAAPHGPPDIKEFPVHKMMKP